MTLQLIQHSPNKHTVTLGLWPCPGNSCLRSQGKTGQAGQGRLLGNHIHEPCTTMRPDQTARPPSLQSWLYLPCLPTEREKVLNTLEFFKFVGTNFHGLWVFFCLFVGTLFGKCFDFQFQLSKSGFVEYVNSWDKATFEYHDWATTNFMIPQYWNKFKLNFSLFTKDGIWGSEHIIQHNK